MFKNEVANLAVAYGQAFAVQELLLRIAQYGEPEKMREMFGGLTSLTVEISRKLDAAILAERADAKLTQTPSP